METQIVQGTAATHTIEIRHRLAFTTFDQMMAEYHASDVCHLQTWSPENGAGFRSVGQATGWLKKLLKKNGWPEPTTWIVQATQVLGSAQSVEIYLR